MAASRVHPFCNLQSRERTLKMDYLYADSGQGIKGQILKSNLKSKKKKIIKRTKSKKKNP
jgi:hypothetical protein